MADNLYTGRRGAGLAPGAAYELYENYFAYVGSIGLSATPTSSVAKGFVYVGRRGASILSDENNPEFSKEYAGSINHGWIPDFVELEATFVYAGSLGLGLTPGADYGTARNYEGALTVVLAPASAPEHHRAYNGQVTVVLTPTVGAGVPHYEYTGSITVQIRPISEYEGTGIVIREYTGNIPVALLPVVSDAIRDAVYAGALAVGFAPQAAYEVIPVGEFGYAGILALGLAPGSLSRLVSGVGSLRLKKTLVRPRYQKTSVKEN